MLASLIIPILYYALIKKYTDNILKHPNCTCVLEEYIKDMKQKSLYLIIGQFIVTILKLINAPQLIISITSIIVFIILILVFINWNNITKNIEKIIVNVLTLKLKINIFYCLDSNNYNIYCTIISYYNVCYGFNYII